MNTAEGKIPSTKKNKKKRRGAGFELGTSSLTTKPDKQWRGARGPEFESRSTPGAFFFLLCCVVVLLVLLLASLCVVVLCCVRLCCVAVALCCG